MNGMAHAYSIVRFGGAEGTGGGGALGTGVGGVGAPEDDEDEALTDCLSYVGGVINGIFVEAATSSWLNNLSTALVIAC